MTDKKHERKKILEAGTKQDILEAVVMILTRDGIQNFTMDKVAVEVMDLTILNAEMELPQRYAGKIPSGLPISLSFSTLSDSIPGKIVAVNPKVDTLNRTFLVKVAVDNRDGKLQAGLFCSASFKLPLIKDQMSIPTAALSRDEGRSTVWIVENGKVHLRNVREGGSLNGWVWILDGLKPRDKVVVEGAGGLTEDAEVTVN